VTLKKEITKTKSGLRAWHQERSIFETTNMICEMMEERAVRRSDLARRLGTNKSFITQLLDGSANMTLRTISDVFLELGYEFHPCRTKIEKDGFKPVIEPFHYDVDQWDPWTADISTQADISARIGIGTLNNVS
jgi:hypothetical protein